MISNMDETVAAIQSPPGQGRDDGVRVVAEKGCTRAALRQSHGNYERGSRPLRNN